MAEKEGGGRIMQKTRLRCVANHDESRLDKRPTLINYFGESLSPVRSCQAGIEKKILIFCTSIIQLPFSLFFALCSAQIQNLDNLIHPQSKKNIKNFSSGYDVNCLPTSRYSKFFTRSIICVRGL